MFKLLQIVNFAASGVFISFMQQATVVRNTRKKNGGSFERTWCSEKQPYQREPQSIGVSMRALGYGLDRWTWKLYNYPYALARQIDPHTHTHSSGTATGKKRTEQPWTEHVREINGKVIHSDRRIVHWLRSVQARIKYHARTHTQYTLTCNAHLYVRKRCAQDGRAVK